MAIIEKVKKMITGKDEEEKNPFDLPKKEEEIVQQIEDQIKEDKQARARWEIEAYMNRNYLDGNQWIGYSKADSKLKVMPLRPGEKRVTVNLFRSKKRGTKSLIIKNDPRIHIAAGGGVTATKKELQIANLYIQKLWRDKNMRKIIGKVLDYAFNSGHAPLYYDWGDDGIEIWADDPLDAFCDAPTSGEVEDCAFYTRTFLKSFKDIWDDPLYKDKRHLLKSVKDEGKYSLSDRKNEMLLSRHGKLSSKQDFTKKGIVRERWVKVNGKIRIQTTVAGEVLIRDEDANRDKYPVLIYRAEEEAGLFYTRAWLSDLIDPQKSVNNTATAVESWVHYVDKVKMLAHKSTKFSSRTDSWGQVIRYTGPRAPEFEQPKPLPDTVFAHLRQSIGFMESQTIHSESQGSTNQKSGIAIAQLQAGNVTNVSDPVSNLRTFLEDVIERLLEEISRNFNQVKEIVLDDENGNEMKVKVVGDEAIKGSEELLKKMGGESEDPERSEVVRLKAFKTIKVEIIPGDAFSDLVAKEEAKELFQAEAIDQQTLLDTYKIGNTRDIIDRMQSNKEKEKLNNPDLVIAEAENIKLIKGETVMAEPEEDHEIHLTLHSAVLKKAQQSGNKELVQRIIAHMQEHEAMKQYMDQKMKQPAAAPPAMPAAPTGPERPAQPAPVMPGGSAPIPPR